MRNKNESMITKTEVKQVASLAHLKLNNQEVSKFQKQLTEMLAYFARLNQLKTSKVEPITQIMGQKNITQKDQIPEKSFPIKAAISNAPAKHQNYFKVKGIFTE